MTLLVAVVADLFAVSQPYEGSMAASISLAGTLHFLPLFAAGSALAIRREALASTAWLNHRSVHLGILAASLTLYVRGHAWAVALATPPGPASAQPMLVEDYIVGLGALLLVGLVASGLGAKVLASRPLLALGKASYSLYLWHLPVLVASVLLLAPHLGIIAATGVGLCADSGRHLGLLPVRRGAGAAGHSRSTHPAGRPSCTI